MRKYVFFWKNLVGILPFLFLGTACDSTSDDPEPFLKISGEDQTITLSADGTESKTIAVETNTSEWTVSVKADDKSWCTAKKDGESIVVSVEKNDGVSERSTTLTAIAQNIKVEITVTQLGANPVLQIRDEDKVLPPFEISGGTAEVNILTNIPLEELVVALSDASATWCEPKMENGKLTIYVEENIGEEARNVDIIITSDRIQAEQLKITVTQFGTGYTLQIAEGSGTQNFKVTGDSKVVDITTNIPDTELSVTLSEPTVNWLKTKIENSKLTITVGPNSGWDERTVDITITSDKLPEAHPKIIVIQAGVIPILEISSNTENFDVVGGDSIVDITTNIPDTELSVTLSEPVDWLKTKIENGKLTITVDPNPGWDGRTVDITIISNRLPVEQHPKIVVVQAGVIPVLEISSNTENFGVVGGDNIVEITTSIPDTELSVTLSDPTVKWLQTKIENGKLTITVDPNPELNLRTVNITITSNRLPDVKPVIIVTQFGKNPTLEIGNIEKNFDATKGSEIVDLITNIPDTELSFTLSDPTVNWLQTKIENGKLTITVESNPELNGRTVDITITSDRLLDVQPRVTVTQSGGDPNLSIKNEDITKDFDTAGNSKIVDLITNIPNDQLNITLNDETVNWCHIQIENSQLTITTDVTPGLAPRSVVITVTSELIPTDQQPKITVTQGTIDSGTDFSITGYENVIFDVVFYNNSATSKLALDTSGKGRLATTGSSLTIKSIKDSEGTEILIGRKESDGEIKLAVNADHKVQWRLKESKTPWINTAAELRLLSADNTNTLSRGYTYTFESDIDLMNEAWTPISISGNVEGEQHKIENLKITAEGAGNWGLFKSVTNLWNLHIVSGTITVTGGTYVGAFVGQCSGQITGCSNRATVNSNYAGGICGSSTGSSASIRACANYGAITATGAGAGGICYILDGSSSAIVAACYNAGEITANVGGSDSYYCGGIVGRVDKGKVNSCYNTGKIVKQGNSSKTDVGAINGSNDAGTSAITKCFYRNGSYASAGASNTSSKVFSSEEGGWPIADSAYWRTGDGTDDKYWSDFGSWNGGQPQYPRLFWE
ncbi:hypothetical protein EZS27_007285 [termite gut metagenome]|uniref:BACON domain-containing protein n=1 Tax=termite gut metagenome TaxID=433724 RepID=A0A5J4SGA0_9ZZZZ